MNKILLVLTSACVLNVSAGNMIAFAIASLFGINVPGPVRQILPYRSLSDNDTFDHMRRQERIWQQIDQGRSTPLKIKF